MKNKQRIGGGIVAGGFILAFLAMLLDLVLTGQINVGQTPIFLLLCGLVISMLGAAYIGAGTTSALKRQKKQIAIMRTEMSAKEREIKTQREALEKFSDSRLRGLSETVDKMEFLAQSKEMTELPTKSSTQIAIGEIGAPVEKPKPPEEKPKPAMWDKKPKMPLPPAKAKASPLPPPPPKDMVVPGGPPKGMPPPPKDEKPAPPVSDELIEDEDKDEEDVPTVVCTKCKSKIKGKWAVCPFCDAELPKVEDKPGDKIESKEPEQDKGEEEDEEGKGDLISDVLSEVMKTTASYGVGDGMAPKEPVSEEDEDEEEGETDAEEVEEEEEPDTGEDKEEEGPDTGEDKEAATEEEDAGTESPKEDSIPLIPPLPEPLGEEPKPEPPQETGSPEETSPSDEEPKSEGPNVCPNCDKTVKPHWRNCPYCKHYLKG